VADVGVAVAIALAVVSPLPFFPLATPVCVAVAVATLLWVSSGADVGVVDVALPALPPVTSLALESAALVPLLFASLPLGSPLLVSPPLALSPWALATAVPLGGPLAAASAG